MKRLLKDYKTFLESWKLNETTQLSGYVSMGDNNKMLDEANVKIKRAIVWININKAFYAELLQYVNIYGTFDLEHKTMATDGVSIMFHPEFVLAQTDAAIRFVLCHEILHCINEHHERRGTRNPQGWNIACDYAINPILDGEEGFEWPQIDGKRIGLYEKRFAGMNAEDIYEILKQESKLNKDGKPGRGQPKSIDDILQKGDDTPMPGGEMVQQGQFDDEGEEESGEDEGEGKGKPGEDEGKGKEGEGSTGKKEKGGDKKSKDTDKGGETSELPSVGDKVKLRNGREAVVKMVYPDGSIEV